MKKAVIVALAVILVAVIVTSFVLSTLYLSPTNPKVDGLKEIGSYEQGTLYQTTGTSGQFFVVDLHGSFHDMGRQYGYLLKSELKEFYDSATGRLIGAQNISQAEIEQAAEGSFQIQPSYMQDLIVGMSETSGLSLTEQKVSSSLFGFLFGCSSLDAWGNYTKDGAMVIGRNWDTGRGSFDGYSKYLTVVVYNPIGARSVAEVNYVGCAGFQSGINDAGIFLDLQNGQISDPAVYAENRPGAFLLLDFLLNSTTLGQVNGLLQANQPNMGLIINAADASTATVNEWATYETKTRTSDGLISSSNHYLNASWSNLTAVPDGVAGAFSKERQTNLMNLGEQNKGNIDADKMMQIFDTTIPDGGATFPDDSPYETYYHIVAVPGEFTLWLKAPGYSDWERVNLNALFQTTA